MLSLEKNLHLAELNSTDPVKIADTLGIPLEELAELIGLECRELQLTKYQKSSNRPKSLRELVRVLKEIEPRFDSISEAIDWFKNESLPGFNGRTAEQLVQQGQSQQLLKYIDAVDSGVYA